MRVSRSEIRKVDFVPACFEEIRRGFDPAFSYVVFESEGGDGGRRLIEVWNLLEGLTLPLVEIRTFQDRGREVMLLIAKFDSERTDTIIEEIIGAGLPKDVVFCGYGSSQAG